MATQEELKEKVANSSILELFRQKAREKRTQQATVPVKENVNYNEQTFEGVRGYLDENGTAWLNVEDVARGLGFTHEQTINGKQYSHIRWSTINGYLRDFNFCQEVGKDDFIPENMFYRLAMKASNKVAEDFQAKVADEILPAIRRTGRYEVKPMTTAEILHAVTGQIVEHERLLKEQQQQISALRTEQDIQGKEQDHQRQQISSLAQDMDTVKDVVFPNYSNVNKEWAQQLSVSVYHIAGGDDIRMSELWLDIQERFCNTFELDIGIELERAKEFLRALYYREKEMHNNPAKDILRPAAIQKLSFCSMVTMKSEWYFTIQNIIEEFRNNE